MMMNNFDRYKHWFLSYNKQCYKEHVFLICVADPRVFIKLKLDNTFKGINYLDFISIDDIQWLDGKPNKHTQQNVLDEAMQFIFDEVEESHNLYFMNYSIENLIDEF